MLPEHRDLILEGAIPNNLPQCLLWRKKCRVEHQVHLHRVALPPNLFPAFDALLGDFRSYINPSFAFDKQRILADKIPRIRKQAHLRLRRIGTEPIDSHQDVHVGLGGRCRESS